MYAQQKGFTLIELLVVIAITAIMATIALPNMSEWIASRRAASQAEQVANLLRFARAEAVRLNLPVYVCPVKVRKHAWLTANATAAKKAAACSPMPIKTGTKPMRMTQAISPCAP